MRQIITSEQAKQLDLKTQERDGVSEEELMERAGLSIVDALLQDFPSAHKVIIVVGPGNNGGDGLVIARELLKNGKSIKIVCPERGSSTLWLKKESELQSERLKASHSENGIIFLKIPDFYKTSANEVWDLLVDAAFGVGLSRELTASWKQTLQFVGERARERVAIDVPSGLNGTTGIASVGTLRVHKTYTIGVAKLGLLMGDGPRHVGAIKTIDIGFSSKAQSELDPKIYFFGLREAQKILPQRSHWKTNKSSRGHLLVIAGSTGMEGAGVLSAAAGARMGSGYVTWAQWPEVRQKGSHLSYPYLLTALLDEDLNFLKNIKKPNAIVLGPGLGKDKRSLKLINSIYNFYKNNATPIVVDADALHLFKLLKKYPIPSHWILTPHSGELNQLLRTEEGDEAPPFSQQKQRHEELQQDRLAFLLKGQSQLGGHLLLKGHRSLIRTPAGDVFLIGSGDPSLAKAGTGDVLAGMIGGLLTGGMSSSNALCLAAYLHGTVGKIYTRKYKNDFSLVATDIIELLPMVIKNLMDEKEMLTASKRNK